MAIFACWNGAGLASNPSIITDVDSSPQEPVTEKKVARLVSVVGFSEFGVFRSNEKGNVRIPISYDGNIFDQLKTARERAELINE